MAKVGMWREPRVGGGRCGRTGPQPGPDYQACQASRMVGREARAGEDHRRTHESSSPCLGSCSFSHLVCPSPAKAHVRHFLRAGEQATANNFSENER